MKMFHPDGCSEGQCIILSNVGACEHPDNVVGVMCQHHQSMKDAYGLDEAGILKLIFQNKASR